MYCLAVIMCQSCTSGMWGRVPGRLVWSRRLVCVYLTAPHSCVLSKCNRRRPHPSEKGILPFPPPLFLLLFLLLPQFFRSSASVVKMSANRQEVASKVSLRITMLAQLFSLFKRVCISQEVPYEQVIQAQHMWGLSEIGLCLWQHRRNLSKSNLSNNLSRVKSAIKRSGFKHVVQSSLNALLVHIMKSSCLAQEIEHKIKYIFFKGQLVTIHHIL